MCENEMKLTARNALRGLFLAPVLLISIWLSMWGMLGTGFGAGRLVVAYLIALPAFLLNIISPKWGVIGAVIVVFVDYWTRLVVTWATFNPLAVLSTLADRLMLINLVLTLASAYLATIRGKKEVMPV